MRKRSAVLLSLVLFFSCVLGGNAGVSSRIGKPKTIHGIVVNQDGKPIPKAAVYAITTNGLKFTYNKIIANKKGKFTYTQRSSTPLVAVADGYSYGSPTYGSKSPRITLYPGFTLKGKIVDEAARPVPGAKVVLEQFWGNDQNVRTVSFPNYARWSEVTTDAKGVFLLPHLPDPQQFSYSSMTLSVGKRGRAQITKDFRGRDMSRQVSIVQPLECIAEGIVSLQGKTGPIPSGTEISVQLPPKYGYQPRQAPVGKDGRFRLSELPPGKAGFGLTPHYRRNAGGDSNFDTGDWVAPAVTGLLDPKQPLKLQMTLMHGAVIKGVVKKKADGQPMKDAQVYATHAGSIKGSPVQVVQSTNERGEFQLRVVPGDVELTGQLIERNAEYQGTLPLSVAEGEEKSGVELELTADRYQEAEKPALPDFELKAGTYDLVWDPEITCRGFSSSPAKEGAAVVALLKGKPKAASKKAMYKAFQLDGRGNDGLLAMAFDKSKGQDSYDVIYVDRNRNWDLSDEAPITVEFGEGGYQSELEWVEVQSHQGIAGGDSTNHPLQVAPQVYNIPGRGLYCMLQTKGGWKGAVDTNKGLVECAVADNNFNGVCGDNMAWKKDGSPAAFGDIFFVDDNGLGKVETRWRGPQSIWTYPISQVGSKFYSIKVVPLGNKVTIEPYAGPMGSILVSAANIQGMSGKAKGVSVFGNDAEYNFSDCAGNAVTVPVGSYQVKRCSLELEDAKGKKLPIMCNVDRSVEVKPDEQSVIELSGKLSLAISPSQKQVAWHSGSTETFEWSIRAGKDITLTGLGDRTRVSAPKVKFINKQGKVLRTVKAGYT